MKQNIASYKYKLGICLIHNNETYIPAKETIINIERIAKKLEIETITFEIFQQELFKYNSYSFKSVFRLIKLNFLRRKLENDFSNYLKTFSYIKFFGSSIRFCFYVVSLFFPKFLKRENKRIFIENEISKKHQFALKEMSRMQLDFLIVVEFDAIWNNLVSSQIFNYLFKEIFNFSNDKIYVDLGGGYSINFSNVDFSSDSESLKASNVSMEIIKLSQPITNTACGYLVSRELCKSFQELKGKVAIPIDWQFNEFFMKTTDSEIKCYLTKPEPLIHGSFAGMTNSWQPKSPESIFLLGKTNLESKEI